MAIVNSATVKNEVSLVGRGLFSGIECTALIKPAKAGQGIVFYKDDQAIPAIPSSFIEMPSCTVIGNGPVAVSVTEHLMAALWAAGIDTAAIHVTGPELPNLDGSAGWHYAKILEAGRTEFGSRPMLPLDKPLVVGDATAFIIIAPNDSLEIAYHFNHMELGMQVYVGDVDRAYAASDIIPARTFITQAEAQAATAAGHLKNTHEEDALVIRGGEPDQPLRFADEYARHKVLDLLGDLYNVPAELTGRITAYRSGHALNRELARQLSSLLV